MRRRHAPAPRRATLVLAGLAFLVGAVAVAPAAWAETSVLTKNGTLYEIVSARLGDVVDAEPGTASRPVLAFKTTQPGGQQTVEVVAETADDAYELPGDIEYEELTGTVFLVYTRFQGIQSDVHFALRRGSSWREETLVPSIGFYVSLNPRVVVTRQIYRDRDQAGNTVTKTRSILHLVWWEDTSVSQARYAAVFVEDGVLALDSVVARDLNELAGVTGWTDAYQFPFASYGYPSVHPDAATNGGVRVSFANLADRASTVISITFPDDLTKLTPAPPAGGVGAPAPVDPVYARGHTPVGRTVNRSPVERSVDTNSSVSTALSVSGVPTFFWTEGNRVRYIRAGSPEGTVPTALALRADLPLEKAERLVREMARRD